METVGKRQVKINTINRISWFTKEPGKLKKNAYFQYIPDKIIENWNYRNEQNEVNGRIKELKKNQCEIFIKGMKRHMYGHVNGSKIRRTVSSIKLEVKDTGQTNKITPEHGKTLSKSI